MLLPTKPQKEETSAVVSCGKKIIVDIKKPVLSPYQAIKLLPKLPLARTKNRLNVLKLDYPTLARDAGISPEHCI